MWVLIIDKFKRIKLIYKGLLEGNLELIQLSLDFDKENNINKNQEITFINKAENYFNNFLNKKKKRWENYWWLSNF